MTGRIVVGIDGSGQSGNALELAPDLTWTLTGESGHPANLLTKASYGADAVVVGLPDS